MTTPNVTRAAIRTLAAAALLAAFAAAPRAVLAAPPAVDGDKPAAERPMPKHFDELDLSDEQKQQTWDTLDAYNARIQKVSQLMMMSRLQGGSYSAQADTDALIKVLKKKRALALRSILTENQLAKLDALHAADVAAKP